MEFMNETRQLRAKLIILCTLMANKCMTKAFKCECKRECMERIQRVLLEHLALNMNILSEYIHILSIFLFLCAVFFRVALFIFLYCLRFFYYNALATGQQTSLEICLVELPANVNTSTSASTEQTCRYKFKPFGFCTRLFFCQNHGVCPMQRTYR